MCDYHMLVFMCCFLLCLRMCCFLLCLRTYMLFPSCLCCSYQIVFSLRLYVYCSLHVVLFTSSVLHLHVWFVVYMLFPLVFPDADNAANANFFREVGGVEAVTELLPFVSTRPLALRLITHLVLSEGKHTLLVIIWSRLITACY